MILLPSAICATSCFNGGECGDPSLNNCSCPLGFNGSLCQKREYLPIFFLPFSLKKTKTDPTHSRHSYSFGACQRINSTVTVFTLSYIFFPTSAVCNNYCFHNGECTEPERCTCPPGYSGKRCETCKYLLVSF